VSFYETKPRKAKYAFEIRMSDDILNEGALFSAVHGVIYDLPESKETWWKEYRNGAGTYSLHLYINDDAIYDRIKVAIAPYGK
jgi:hypothetical protein